MCCSAVHSTTTTTAAAAPTTTPTTTTTTILYYTILYYTILYTTTTTLYYTILDYTRLLLLLPLLLLVVLHISVRFEQVFIVVDILNFNLMNFHELSKVAAWNLKKGIRRTKKTIQCALNQHVIRIKQSSVHSINTSYEYPPIIKFNNTRTSKNTIKRVTYKFI